MKLTPIFPPHIKPVRKGVYKVSYVAGPLKHWAYWDGVVWSSQKMNKHNAEATKASIAFYQNKCWQGVEHG